MELGPQQDLMTNEPWVPMGKIRMNNDKWEQEQNWNVFPRMWSGSPSKRTGKTWAKTSTHLDHTFCETILH